VFGFQAQNKLQGLPSGINHKKSQHKTNKHHQQQPQQQPNLHVASSPSKLLSQ
jgi:hypothetical protein